MADNRLEKYSKFFEDEIKSQGLKNELEFFKSQFNRGEKTPFDASRLPDGDVSFFVKRSDMFALKDYDNFMQIDYIKDNLINQIDIGGRSQLAFIMTGIFESDSKVNISNVFLDRENYEEFRDAGVEYEMADWSSILPNFQRFVYGKSDKKKAVVVGYMTPEIDEGTNDSNCFTFEDMEIALAFSLTYSKDNVQIFLMQVNSIGDFNIVGYEKSAFKKYPNISLDKDGVMQKLPSFTKGGYISIGNENFAE